MLYPTRSLFFFQKSILFSCIEATSKIQNLRIVCKLLNLVYKKKYNSAIYLFKWLIVGKLSLSPTKGYQDKQINWGMRLIFLYFIFQKGGFIAPLHTMINMGKKTIIFTNFAVCNNG